MNVPRIEVTMLEDSTINLSLIRRLGATPLDVPLNFDDLLKNGFDEGAFELGKKILSALKIWNEEKFKNAPTSEKANSFAPDNYDAAMTLLEISVSSKTSKYVESIESLLTGYQAKNKIQHDFLDNDWPVIKNRLISFE